MIIWMLNTYTVVYLSCPAADESPLHDACPSPSTSCDSPHHTSATTVSKDSGCSSGESTLKQDKPKDTPEKEWLTHLPEKLMTSSEDGSTVMTSSANGSTIMTSSANGSTLRKSERVGGDDREFLQDDQEIISITSNGEIRIEREDGVMYTSMEEDKDQGKNLNDKHTCDKQPSVIDRKSVQVQVQENTGSLNFKRSQNLKDTPLPPVPQRRRPQVPCRTTSLTPGTSPSHSETVRSVSTQVQRRHRPGSPLPTTDHLISTALTASSPKVKTATVRQLSSPVSRRLLSSGTSTSSSSPPLSPSRGTNSPERGSLSRSTGTLSRRTSTGSSPDRSALRSSGGLHTHRTPRPMSVTLESLMISKLQDEQIDLSTQPYTDKVRKRWELADARKDCG